MLLNNSKQLTLTELESFAVLLLKTSLLETLRDDSSDLWKDLEFFIPQEVRRSNSLRNRIFPNNYHPDICFQCHYDFGDTLGGRLRNGCPICNSTDWEKYSVVGTFILSTGLHPAHAELVIARVIRNYL